MPPPPELDDQRLSQDFGAAVRERHLRQADGDSHRCSESGDSAFLQSGDALFQLRDRGARLRMCLVDDSQDGSVERPLVAERGLHVPPHQLLENELERGEQEAAKPSPAPGLGQERHDPR